MKAKFIGAFIVIAIAITIVISMVGDASTYVTFGEAKQLSEKGFKKSIHVVGKLPRTTSGEIVGIEESPDKLSFEFEMIDAIGIRQKVLHADPIPTDFIRSEQVVIVGTYQGEKFIAEKILLKCPSKYQEEPEFNS